MREKYGIVHNDGPVMELTTFMTEDGYTDLDKAIFNAVAMIRKQKAEIKALKEKTLSITDDEAMDLWNEVSSHPAEFARAIIKKANQK